MIPLEAIGLWWVVLVVVFPHLMWWNCWPTCVGVLTSLFSPKGMSFFPPLGSYMLLGVKGGRGSCSSYSGVRDPLLVPLLFFL